MPRSPGGHILRRRILAEYGLLIAWAIIAIGIVLSSGSAYLVAFFTFGAVIAASLLIAWAAEASEFSISRGLALAIVAIVQTIPEYFVEGTIAWKAGQDPLRWLPNVIANFTGANRLLTGLGWPLILFTLIVQRRRNGRSGSSTIALRKEQSVELIFLLGASLFYVWILIEGALTIWDSIVLVAAFVAYMWTLARLPADKEEPKETLAGPTLTLTEIKSKGRKLAAIAALFLFGGLTFLLITDAFVESIRRLAETFLVGVLGSGAVFFSIQWIAPFLSEFPEKVTAFNWARQIYLAPMALLNFVSSAVNELTALVALIPIVFIVSRGVFEPVPVADHRVEIFLTMAQSLYACTTLLDLEYDWKNALVLFVLWGTSTALVQTRLEVAVIFLALAVVEVVSSRKHIVVFSAFRKTMREVVFRPPEKLLE